MSDELNRIVDEIQKEQEEALKKTSVVDIFRSLLNQPEYITLSSKDTIEQNPSTGFNTFTLSLPRPILNAETIQLVSATIPQCTQNIPDTACTFWYYKLSAYSGFVPCINNLHFVRLLPSYYKQEQIYNPQDYGYNRLFTSYEDLETEIQKACLKDLGDTVSTGRFPQLTINVESIFLPNDISIKYDKTLNKFKMVGNNVYTIPNVAAYNSVNVYQIGSIVLQGGIYYKARILNAAASNPSSSPAAWEVITIVPFWDATITYALGATVIYNDIGYVAISSSINHPPDVSPLLWFNDGQAFCWNRYFITNYNDPNVRILQGSIQRPWEADYVFEINDIVLFNGITFRALRQSKNLIPVESSWWETIADNAPFIGLTDLSSTFDFKYIGVLDIPSQPYAINPQRLLNSILGFTFNGSFNNGEFGVGYDGNNSVVVSRNDITFLNRLRPIPPYILRPVPPPLNLLGAIQLNPFFPTGNPSYTAEGFCCLVYSQSALIYASIVAGSTLNSSSNTGVLGTALMNTNALGVSFFQESFSNPLSINGSDIYTISFEIKDDFNEPYLLTNNAKIVLVLKVQYKNKKIAV